MAAKKTRRKTANKVTENPAKRPDRTKERPPRREDPGREAAARRIYADEESILKADAADEGMHGIRTKRAGQKEDGAKRPKTGQAAASRTKGSAKNLKAEKPGAARAGGANAKDHKGGKAAAVRSDGVNAKDRKGGKAALVRDEEINERTRRNGKSGMSRASGESRESEKTKRQLEESAKTKNGRDTAAENTKAKTKRDMAAETAKSRAKREAAAETAKSRAKREAAAETAKQKAKRDAAAETAKPKAARPAAGAAKASAKRTGVPAAAKNPPISISVEGLFRELRQAVHFDKKVFAGAVCAIVILSILLINITELGGITRQPLTDVSAGHNALANQMMKDLTVQTQSITDIEDAERAAEEEAMRAQMDAEAYEAQLAAEQAAYDAAHGDESDLFTTMEVRDPDELRITLAENNAYAIGDSMIEGMNDGQYVNTENLIFRRGCGTYDSFDLFERAVNLQASIVWVQLGLNDMDMFHGDVEQFRNNYRELILYLQENLPDCRIFLCNINPISEDACRRHPQYEYADVYNQVIMELCEELGVTFVDNTTLVLGHPELWDTDGIHPVQDVYLWMLSHMCYEAGI
ncbi:MAG: hypothetical protein J6E44_08480 [Lachnospiraceae bacterium]|nr:hypothetical protein [Lachnospiraceae bacterium]